ncbi:MAG: sulfite exporter TauE/SafE family protein [Solirubrobacterales bacterium]
MGDAALGALIAFAIATVTTPVGVSGAVFLIPVQLSVLGTPSPAVTPTNLLYNLLAIPGALLRFHGEGRLGGPLLRAMLVGSLPGMVAGAVIRTQLLGGGHAFLIVVAAVLAPLGAWLAFGTPAPGGGRLRPATIALLSLAVGVVGGIYGIGGGSILAPLLVGCGYSVLEVSPAALTTTFLASIVGVASFALLGLSGEDVPPDWAVGVGMGIGGLAGGYLGARLQPRLPVGPLRRGLGLLALVLAARYALQALS